MKKTPTTQRSKPWLPEVRSRFINGWALLKKNAKPFLAPKYWLIYLCCFGIGFYLWGPFHGLEKIKFQPVRKSKEQQTKQVSIETLQREVNNLKLKLQAAQAKIKTPAFDPASFSRPASGQVILGSEWQYSDKCWRFHSGVDIALALNSNVITAAAGTIITVKHNPGGGYSVTIDHGGGWETVYANLAEVSVRPGQNVIKGVILGTGIQNLTENADDNTELEQPAHLHFEIYHDKQPVDPRQIIEGLR